jgi:hypothetical protein
MRIGNVWFLAGTLVAGSACAQAIDSSPTTRPTSLADQPLPRMLSLQPAEPPSVYAPPLPRREDQGINEGAVHFELRVAYLTDYIYRGIEIFEPPVAEDTPSLQLHSKLSFDTGKFPHPFVGVFANVLDSDPISSFQEIRPYFGFEWTMRPIILSGGYNSYIYPDRDESETAEFWGKLQIDDSFFFNSEHPFLSPYVYAAYDYDLYSGWYFEGGVSHEIKFDEIGLTLTGEAHIAYIRGFELYAAIPSPGPGPIQGFQHYQVGVTADYSLNTLLNVSTRYGQWSLQGYGYYTDGIDDDLRYNRQLWGGAGIMLRY